MKYSYYMNIEIILISSVNMALLLVTSAVALFCPFFSHLLWLHTVYQKVIWCENYVFFFLRVIISKGWQDGLFNVNEFFMSYLCPYAEMW